MITHILDHAARALALLPSQFAESTKLRALISAFADAAQDIEDDTWACIEDRMLDTAEGAQLDQYGRVLGQPRDGLSDDDFRALLGIRILANRSNGQADIILRVVAGLLDPERLTNGVEYTRHGTAEYRVSWEADDATSADRLALIVKILDEITPAGVAYTAVEGKKPAFRFDTENYGLDQGQLCRLL
jgi:hypothetical protein